MKYAFLLSTALLMAIGQLQPASAQAPLDLVKQSVEALGGVNALRGLKTVVIKGDVKHSDPGQSPSVNGPPRFFGQGTVTVSVDFSEPVRARYDWDRDMQYPAVEKSKYSEIRYPTYGVVIDDKGEARPMSGNRLATNIRESGRQSPVLLLRAMDSPQSLSAIEDQNLGNQTLPAVVYTVGPTKYIIMFDRSTHLPAAVRTRDADHIYGDSNFDLVLSDWRTVGGIKFAFTRSTQLNGTEVEHRAYKEITPNAQLAANTFAVPDAVKAAAKPPATGNVPYQWVIRRLFLNRYVDSDEVYFAPGGKFNLEQLAPDVQYVTGTGARNLIVNMKDGLVVFDAPTDNGQSEAVIKLAKEKYPGKSIKYLVLTHHHMDHTGGMRAYVAEGATVIVPAPDKAFFEQVAKAPHTIVPDAQQRAMKPANIIEVRDTYSIKDDADQIDLFNIPNPHAEGMLLGHVVKDNIVWVTDLVSPPPRGQLARDAGSIAVGDALRKHNIANATVAGGHGGTAKQIDIAQALAAN
jgi:glyoxylase-like metal-dependent hydrolase (beta-lactamase superfamily II)